MPIPRYKARIRSSRGHRRRVPEMQISLCIPADAAAVETWRGPGGAA
jgi:hypothetical protein